MPPPPPLAVYEFLELYLVRFALEFCLPNGHFVMANANGKSFLSSSSVGQVFSW